MPTFLHDLLVNIALTTPLVGAYTMFALGLVFIYRASRVLNLAHGAMAMLPAYVSYAVAKQAGLGVFPGLVAALAVGGALGLVVERGVVRRLRGASQMAQTVGTVGVLGLLIALAVRGWGTTPLRAPSVFPAHQFRLGNSHLELGDIGLLVSALIVAVAFLALFRFTDLGLAMRCAADNRRAALLMGIDPDRTTAVAWGFAGLLAALGGVLLGASTDLHPYTLSLPVLPAFVAALIGGLENVSGAVVGSLVVGLTIGVVPSLHGIGHQVGASEVALTALAFVVMSLRGKRFSVADSGGGL
ncbi:MAG: branched-chain amino acid ABC transporter permease [Acidimicrobiales bacterium]